MYSLSQSKGTTKLLLQSGRQDYGTNNDCTFVLNEIVQAPPFSFGLIGVEKMYWRHPSVFPSDYLQATLTLTPLSGVSTAATTASITSTNFTQSVTMNGVTNLTNLSDCYYDGSGGEFLARLLDCFLITLNAQITTLAAGSGGTYSFDYSSTTFTSWNALSTTASTSSSLSKMDAATNWMRNNYENLKLVFKATTGSIMAITFTDTTPNNGLVSRILNISSGTFTIATTSGTYSAGVFSNSVPIQINFEGLNYIKLRCSAASGFKEAHRVVAGVQPTSLLALVPCTSTPGCMEYYEPVTPNDRVTVKDFSMDMISLQFFDYLERPLTALKDYAVVITIDFMSRETEESSVNVMRR